MTADKTASMQVSFCAFPRRARFITFAPHIARIAQAHLAQIAFKRYGLTAKFSAHKGFGTTHCDPMLYLITSSENIIPHSALMAFRAKPVKLMDRVAKV
jgi:hypothetical protein